MADDNLATQEPSIEDTIKETWAGIQSRGIEDETVEDVAANETPEQKAERQRDTKGRFSTEESAEVVVPKVEAEVKARKAPSSWKPEAQAKFGAIDPLLQEEIERRESDIHKGIENYKGKAAVAEEFERAVAPYMATIQSFGVTPVAAAQELFKADHALRYGTPIQKLQMFQKIAGDYGVDLGPLMEAATNNQPLQIDPNISALQNQVHQMHAYLQNQSRAQEASAQQSVMTDIQRFAADPKHEHFEKIRIDMGALLQAGRANNLDEAYDLAIWANPDTRTLMLSKLEDERRSDAKRKADEAKKAGEVSIPQRGNVPSATPVGSIEDTIRSNAKRLGLIS